MKVLKVVAIVVGVVALVATGAGIALGGLAATASATATTLMTIGAIAGVAGGVLSLGMSLMATRPSFGGQGSPLSFQTNPQSGLPYVIGRTRMSGLKIDGKTTSSKTDGTHNLIFLSALLSCTPVQAVTGFTADGIAVTFDGSGAAIGGEAGWMAQKVSLGPMPQTSALSLTLDGRSYPGHSSTTKLSGMTYAEWALKYDPDGNHFSAGLPEPAWIVVGRKCYDPRKDSTYPGGSGAHRAGNEATYEWTLNGPIQALNWAMGHSANGKRVCGIGAPMENIRVADFVEAANIADANGWGCGGVEWTTDSKWDIFKRMLQAGGAVPSMGGAMLGCRVKTPRVSIGTITQDDFLDDLTYIATKPRRDRFNTVLPRYVSESHDWEVITGSEISVPAYVATDGGKRTKGIDFPLVQAEVGQGYDGNQQAGQLAAYEIVDSREASIECTVKPRWIGLRVGDCVTLDKPDDGIVAQKVMITGVTLDPARGVLRLTAETETDSKHAFALGQTTTPPPAPTLNVPAGKPAVPGPAAWSVTAISMADGQPGLRVAGTIDDPIADRVLVQYRRAGLLDWIGAPDIVGTGAKSLDIGPLDGLTGWDVRLSYSAGGRGGDWLEILSTGTTATSLGQLSGNLLQDSTFANGSTDGWTFFNVPSMVADSSINGGGDSQRPTGENVLTIYQGNAGQSGASLWQSDFNVEAGRWYEPSAFVALHRCPGQLVISWFNSAGGQITPDVTAPIEVKAGGTSLADYARAYLKAKAPVGAVRARFYLKKLPTVVGQADSWAFLSRPQVVETQENSPSPAPYSPSGVGQKGADAVAYVQDATPAAPPNSNQLWIKPSTKQIFRWDGANWVDTHGDLARYNQIVASLFVPDQGVDVAAMVLGTLGSFQSMTTSFGGGASVGAMAGGTFGPYNIVATNANVGQFLRVKMSVNVLSTAGAAGSPATATLYLKYFNGSSWVTITSVSGPALTSAFQTYTLDRTAYGMEIPITWSGPVTYALFLELFGGDTGAQSNQGTCLLDIIARK